MKHSAAFYNNWADKINKDNQKWWHDLDGNPIERNKHEMFMLMVSELSEAMEGARKNLMDDHLPQRKMEEVEIADFVIRLLDFAGGFGYIIPKFSMPIQRDCQNKGQQLFGIVRVVVALCCQVETDKYIHSTADVAETIATLISMCEDYCDLHEHYLWAAVGDKCEYNRTRADHQLENRKQEHGKKW